VDVGFGEMMGGGGGGRTSSVDGGLGGVEGGAKVCGSRRMNRGTW
jgi:hypothetical protein